MGAGLTAAHDGGSAVAAPRTTAPATPLSAVETVAPRRTAAAAATAPVAPLPPTSVPTANPRQHLTDAHPATPPSEPQPLPRQQAPHRILATPNDTITPVEQRLQVPEERHPSPDVAATPPPAEGSRPPPTVLDTAVKRQLENSNGEGAATNPNADFSALDHNDAGCAAEVRHLRSPSGSVRLDSSVDARGEHAETSPSPDAPEHEEEEGGEQQQEENDNLNTVPPPPPQQPEQQQTSSPTITVPVHGYANDGMAYRPITRSASPGQALGQYDGLPLASVEQVLKAKHKVYRICLTGGPCAGKSTMLSAIQAKIPPRTGFRVMCVPEAATLLVTGGMQWDSNIAVAQQSALLRTQLALEDQFYALAVATGAPTVIVSDRGTMDGRAFCSDAQFAEILRGVGSTVDVLRDRYDAVLHMVTAANGAEEFYNLDNPARYEDLDGARASDLRLQEMYVGHPMFRLLDNSTTFEDKIERGLQIVGQVVHKEQCAPSTPSFFLVRRCPQELPVASASYTTYTTVLNNSQMNDIRLLVKREMLDGSCMHFFKSVKDTAGMFPSSSAHSTPRAMSRASGGASFRSSLVVGGAAPSQQRIESAQRISSREYNSLRQHRDRARAEVVMRATHFIYEGANYELTTLLAPSWAAGRQTLTVESCTASAAASRASSTALRLPPFLEVDREVPVESLTTAFLISHRETGALYTSLAFAPVFSRAVVTAVGAHADTENILNSTLSTPRGPSALRAETSALLASPIGAEKPQEAPTAAAAVVEVKEEAVAVSSVPPAPATSVRRGLAPLNVNTAPTAASSTLSKSTPKKTVVAHTQPEVAPHFLDGSVSVQQPRNVVTPSRFSLSGTEEAETGPALAGERPQPERRAVARDPEGILPPIEPKKLSAR